MSECNVGAQQQFGFRRRVKQYVEAMRLHRYIQSRSRLVSVYELRLHAQRPHDDDAPTLAASQRRPSRPAQRPGRSGFFRDVHVWKDYGALNSLQISKKDAQA